MNIWLISDTHFYHSNIIQHCNRPFASIEEMNETMISNWNNTVKKKDIIYHLGDFVYGGKEKVQEIFNRLNGQKILILGNHDRASKNFFLNVGFNEVYKSTILDNQYFLTHKPRPAHQLDVELINIHGHIHNIVVPQYQKEYYFNVSAEVLNYTPINLEEVLK